jgi:hypothetical protein
VPRDALVVAIVPTDLESQQVRRLERLLRPALDGATLREAIDESLGERVDLDALLGGDLVVAATGEVEASSERLEGRLRIEVPGGLD